MVHTKSTRRRKLGVALFVALGTFATLAPDALAIIGMPLTPFSVAGVARRTVRRSYWMGGGMYY
jgi:hypothetical protein